MIQQAFLGKKLLPSIGVAVQLTLLLAQFATAGPAVTNLTITSLTITNLIMVNPIFSLPTMIPTNSSNSNLMDYSEWLPSISNSNKDPSSMVDYDVYLKISQ